MSEDKSDGGRLARKLGIVAAATVTGFLCGWSATGAVGGVVLAAAVGAGVGVSVSRAAPRTCLPRPRWRRGHRG